MKRYRYFRKFLWGMFLLLITSFAIQTLYWKAEYKDLIKKGASEKSITLTKLSKEYSIQGIDISHHQGEINWSKVQKSRIQGHPVSFAIIKATEGGNFIDKKFQHNWEELSKVGLTKGAYHFFRPKTSPQIQADNFIRTVKLKKGDLPPVVDVEVMDGVNSDQIRKNLKIFLNLIEKHYKVKPIIYSSPGFYSKILKNDFLEYPFWISHLAESGVVLNIYKWKFWQYSDKGRIDGINGSIDLNVFYGNRTQYESMIIK
jgi:lysozyme